MTDDLLDRELLVELITREVLATIATRTDICDNPEAVRRVVANGADRVAFHGDAADVPLDLAGYIDHTLLKPDATAAEIDELADEAREYEFASVCVNPTWVRRAAVRLQGSDAKVASVMRPSKTLNAIFG